MNSLLLFYPVFVSSLSFNPRAVRNQSPKFGRELLYSPLSFGFGLSGIRRWALQLNHAAVRQSFFFFGYRLLPLIHCSLSLNQCFLAYIQLCLPLRKLRVNGRILLLAGANHRKTDEHQKDKDFFHIRSKP